MGRSVIGWDIGGAHVKAVAFDGALRAVIQRPCRLWEAPEGLLPALEATLAALGPAGGHAITMTGELVDAFDSRASGVAAILDAVEAALGGAPVRVIDGAGAWLSAPAARAAPMAVASANWRATAGLAARHLADALLVDCGSTTTDLIPVRDGRVAAAGRTDAERLASRELVYTGVVRTPVAALAEALPTGGQWALQTGERFATTADVYTLTGELVPGADEFATADGRSADVAGASARLARQVGHDPGALDAPTLRALAAYLRGCQLHALWQAAVSVLGRAGLGGQAPLVAAGAGWFLVPALARRLGRRWLHFAELLHGDEALRRRAAVTAPAAALAELGWAERLP